MLHIKNNMNNKRFGVEGTHITYEKAKTITKSKRVKFGIHLQQKEIQIYK